MSLALYPYRLPADEVDEARYDTPEALYALLERVAHRRLTTFLAIQGEIYSLCFSEQQAAEFLDAAAGVVGRSSAERRALVNHPAFLCWVTLTLADLNRRLAGLDADPDPLRRRLADFVPMLLRISGASDRSNASGPSFHRLDIDPVIAQSLAPSYIMPASPEEAAASLQRGHPIGFIRDVIGVALDRIATTWPAARDRFDRLVHAVIYLQDADFRSCSASRYVGVIMLSARDGSLLDLEESLVHEAAHQLLYHIVEDEPVIDGNPQAQFRLPWSGQMRDLYGYFHAFFVYVELAHYYERVTMRDGRDGRAAATRLGEIIRGLVAALPDFEASPAFTGHGRQLLGVLDGDVTALADRHRMLLMA